MALIKDFTSVGVSLTLSVCCYGFGLGEFSLPYFPLHDRGSFMHAGNTNAKDPLK